MSEIVTRAEAEKRYQEFVDSLNRITDRDIEENERVRRRRPLPYHLKDREYE